jgi:hypothetical protein
VSLPAAPQVVAAPQVEEGTGQRAAPADHPHEARLFGDEEEAPVAGRLRDVGRVVEDPDLAQDDAAVAASGRLRRRRKRQGNHRRRGGEPGGGPRPHRGTSR